MRPSTLLIVVAVALVGLFAAVDALRGTSTAEPAPTSTKDERSLIELRTAGREPVIEGQTALAAELRRADVAGTLFVTDENCRLRALSLPALKWLLDSGSAGDECEFSVAPDSRHVIRLGGGVAWSPNGRLSASCIRNTVRVFGRTGQEVSGVIGYCAPAWKPDGTLTMARGGTMVAFRLPCKQRRRDCEDVLLSPSDLAPALRKVSTPFRTLRAPAISQTLWLTDSRVALVIHTRVRRQPGSEFDLLAVFEGRRMVGDPLLNVRFDEVAVSPSHRFLAVHGSSFRGLSFVDADGRLLARNPVASGHHVTWSPDETWTAVATGGSTYLVRTAEIELFSSDTRPRTIRIPVYSADLDWR